MKIVNFLILTFICAISTTSCNPPEPKIDENPVIFSAKAQSKYVYGSKFSGIHGIDDSYESNLNESWHSGIPIIIKNDWITFKFDSFSHNKISIEVTENTKGERRIAKVVLVNCSLPGNCSIPKTEVMMVSDNTTKMSWHTETVLEVIQEP